MGIQLDWQVESDQHKRNRAQEDPELRRQRRRNLFWLFFAIILFLCLVSGAVYLISERLRQVDEHIDSILSETVQAEVAALRIGDWQSYRDMQRSATNDWYDQQRRTFEMYQQLKLDERVQIQLPGTVLDVVTDGPRARVQVQEILNGTPYTRTWFYWNYDPEYSPDGRVVFEGGWRHVPPDYTFWGEEGQLEANNITIRYRAVDEPVATSLRDSLNRWLDFACGILTCDNLRPITIDIIASPLEGSYWVDDSARQMVVPSPYVERARTDIPFDTDLRLEVASLLAHRLVELNSPVGAAVYPHDAYYLRTALASWLVGEWVEIDTNSHLMDSLVQHYGQDAVKRLTNALTSTAEMDIFTHVINTPDLAQSQLDWRDLLTWRLTTENDLIQRGDDVALLRLYDTRDEALRTLAYQRYNNNQPPANPVVLALERQTAADGTPQLRATVQTGSNGVYQQDYVLFNLVGNIWKRAN